MMTTTDQQRRTTRERRTCKRKELERLQPDPLTAHPDTIHAELLRTNGIDPDDPYDECWDECDQHAHWPDLSGAAACLPR